MKHPVDTSRWGEFVVGELFDMIQGRRLKKADFIEGEIPYVMASSYNNGVITHISNPITTGQDLLTADIFGNVFYQPSFIGFGDDNCGLKLKNYKANKYQYLFLATVFKKFQNEASFTNKLRGSWYVKQSIKLPIKPSANPSNYDSTDIDWDYMETVMSRVTTRAKERLASLPQPTDKKKTPVDTSAWGEFVVGELFETNGNKTYTGAGIPKNNLEAGSTPRITVTDKNNGIIGYFNDTDNANYRVYENFISVSFLGTVFWHPYKASVDMKVHVLNKLKEAELNEKRALFLVACIKKTIATFSYAEQLSASKLYDLSIKLPLKSSADPKNYTQEDIDWDYMDRFMQTIEEKAHARVASLKKQI